MPDGECVNNLQLLLLQIPHLHQTGLRNTEEIKKMGGSIRTATKTFSRWSIFGPYKEEGISF